MDELLDLCGSDDELGPGTLLHVPSTQPSTQPGFGPSSESDS
eukprot:COSAG03_NODE_8447_length_802_cov_1.099573_1_plen_41_part_01